MFKMKMLSHSHSLEELANSNISQLIIEIDQVFYVLARLKPPPLGVAVNVNLERLVTELGFVKMADESKQIVELLNKDPFQKGFNVFTFHSLSQEQLLQLLNDVFKEIDSTQGGDIREEAPDVRAQRTLTLLKTLKYHPSNTSVSDFRQGIVLGEKTIIHPILAYLLTNLKPLKTRAYLARYLVTLPVPDELLHDSSDREMQENWTRYKELQEHFSIIHKELKELQKQSTGTTEVKSDIKTMEEEKENLTRKVERSRKKVEGTPDFNDVLQVAQRMRTEKQNSEDLQTKVQQQTRMKLSAEQRLQQKKQQVASMMRAGPDASPEVLISRMEEDNRLNQYLLEEKLPKELEVRQKTLKDLQHISMEAMTRKDVNELQENIHQVSDRVNRLVENQMVRGDPTNDKSAVLRQQASILAHKKETLASTLQEKREEATNLERTLTEKRQTLNELGGEVLRGDDYKLYVSKLRTKNMNYKGCRAELAMLRSEHGILTRTEVILKKILDQENRRLNITESKKGVSGFRETQDELEKVSAQKSEMDEVKHRTLDDMSETVQQLNELINEKKTLLAPVIKELRPLRQKRQEVSMEYEEKKAQYESIEAGLESNRAQLEQSVAAIREECSNHDSRYFYIRSMCKLLQSQIDRAETEMKLYTSGDKKKSYREMYNKKIQEQENLSKKLREQKKNISSNQEGSEKQMEMWCGLEKLIECKTKYLQDRRSEVISASSGGQKQSQDRMVL